MTEMFHVLRRDNAVRAYFKEVGRYTDKIILLNKLNVFGHVIRTDITAELEELENYELDIYDEFSSCNCILIIIGYNTGWWQCKENITDADACQKYIIDDGLDVLSTHTLQLIMLSPKTTHGVPSAIAEQVNALWDAMTDDEHIFADAHHAGFCDRYNNLKYGAAILRR